MTASAFIGRQSFDLLHERFPENIPLLRRQNLECVRHSGECILITFWFTCRFGWRQVDHSNAAFPPPYISTNRIDAQGPERFVEPTFVEIELVGEGARPVCHEKIRQVFQNCLAEGLQRPGIPPSGTLTKRFASHRSSKTGNTGAHQLLVVRPPPLSHQMDETLGAQIAGGVAISDQETGLQLGS